MAHLFRVVAPKAEVVAVVRGSGPRLDPQPVAVRQVRERRWLALREKAGFASGHGKRRRPREARGYAPEDLDSAVRLTPRGRPVDPLPLVDRTPRAGEVLHDDLVRPVAVRRPRPPLWCRFAPVCDERFDPQVKRA